MQVPLGIIMKNENKLDEMVDILTSLHKYVPVHELSGSVAVPGSIEPQPIKVEIMHKTLFGGDQMTAARARSAPRLRENSQLPTSCLEGCIPIAEDWHTKLCLLEVRNSLLEGKLHLSKYAHLDSPYITGDMGVFVQQAILQRFWYPSAAEEPN